MFSFTKKKNEAAGSKVQSKKKKARCEVHVSWEESRAPQEQYEVGLRRCVWSLRKASRGHFAYTKVEHEQADGSSGKERVFLAVALWESRGVLAPRPRLLISEVQMWKHVRGPAPSGQDYNARIMSGPEKGLQPQRIEIVGESSHDPHGDPNGRCLCFARCRLETKADELLYTRTKWKTILRRESGGI